MQVQSAVSTQAYSVIRNRGGVKLPSPHWEHRRGFSACRFAKQNAGLSAHPFQYFSAISRSVANFRGNCYYGARRWSEGCCRTCFDLSLPSPRMTTQAKRQAAPFMVPIHSLLFLFYGVLVCCACCVLFVAVQQNVHRIRCANINIHSLNNERLYLRLHLQLRSPIYRY